MAKTSTRLMEEAYISTGDSGVNVKIIKSHTTSKRSISKPRDGKDEYEIQIRHSAWGMGSEFRTPIFSSDHARTMADMYNRIVCHMEESEKNKRVYEWKRPGASNHVRDGLRYEPVRHEYVITPYVSHALWIGENVFHTGTGEFIKFIPEEPGNLKKHVLEEVAYYHDPVEFSLEGIEDPEDADAAAMDDGADDPGDTILKWSVSDIGKTLILKGDKWVVSSENQLPWLKSLYEVFSLTE